MLVARNEQPLVSVIIPAWNAESYLGEAIDSILSQTYENIEILIIDDNSDDGTLKVAELYANKYKRIKVVANSENVGIGHNRSIGIKHAKGKYICWQDADDISLPKRIEKQVTFLESRPQVGIVGGWMRFFNKDGDGLVRRYAEDDVELRSKIFKYNPIAQPASMFRADCYKKVGSYDKTYRLSEDLEMFFRVGEKYQFGNIQDVVVKYRQSGTSLTATKLREMERITFKIRKKYKKSASYNYTFSDYVYNLAQKLSMYMPHVVRISLFKIIRGDS